MKSNQENTSDADYMSPDEQIELNNWFNTFQLDLTDEDLQELEKINAA